MKISEVVETLSPVRQEMYVYLCDQGTQDQTLITVRDIGNRMGMGESVALYHIRKLCDTGLLYQDERGHVHVTGALTTSPSWDLEISDAKPDKFRKTGWRK